VRRAALVIREEVRDLLRRSCRSRRASADRRPHPQARQGRAPIARNIRRAVPDIPRTRGSQKHLTRSVSGSSTTTTTCAGVGSAAATSPPRVVTPAPRNQRALAARVNTATASQATEFDRHRWATSARLTLIRIAILAILMTWRYRRRCSGIAPCDHPPPLRRIQTGQLVARLWIL